MKEASPIPALAGTAGTLFAGPTPVYYGLSGMSVFVEWIRQQNYSQVAILYDSNTALNYRKEIETLFPEHKPIIILAGEASKSLTTCTHLWETLTSLKMDRKSALVNLGGGVVGDLGGFVAASFKRGISFVQIPTTLLSMVDASVGGKVGVNLGNLKNQVGAFSNPDAVFIYDGFLKTLPEREILSGFAEMIKHSLIGNAAQWATFLSAQKPVFSPEFIAESVQVKLKIVTEDPLEKGIRKALNFGHTVGHALESWSMEQGKEKLLHGEAVGIGMACEAWISRQRKSISEPELQEISTFIRNLFPAIDPSPEEVKKISGLALHDKKNEAGLIQCTLLKGIGNFQVNVPISRAEIEESIRYYCDLK